MPLHVFPGQLGMATPIEELIGHSEAEMNAELADYAKLGVNWVRTDFRWNHVQPDSGDTYDWSQLDSLVSAASRYDIKVVALLHDPPAWIYDNGGMSMHAGVRAFGKFAKAAAGHFKGKVQYWEIGNEQNLTNSPSPPDAAVYTQSLKAAYRAIKSVDANSFVITGGLSPVPETTEREIGAVQFLQQMYANGAKGNFDAVGYHPYSWPLQPDDPASWNGWKMMNQGIRDTMVAHGDSGKQIWITEMGAPTKGGAKAVSEQAQAHMLQKAADLAHSYSWAGPLMWYSYRDRGGDPADSENWFGLIRPDGEQKAAYKTFQDIARHDTGTPSLRPVPPRKPEFSPIGDTGILHEGGTVIECSHIHDFVMDLMWTVKGRDLVPYRTGADTAACIQGIAYGNPLDGTGFPQGIVADPGL